ADGRARAITAHADGALSSVQCSVLRDDHAVRRHWQPTSVRPAQMGDGGARRAWPVRVVAAQNDRRHWARGEGPGEAARRTLSRRLQTPVGVGDLCLDPAVPRSDAVDEARAVLDSIPRLVLEEIRDDPCRPREGPGSAPRHAARNQEARPDYKTGVVLLYEALGIPCVPVALNSGLFWPRRSLLRRPGTIVVEFLDPIPPGLPKAEFLSRLTESIETATNRLLAEAKAKEPASSPAVNL